MSGSRPSDFPHGTKHADIFKQYYLAGDVRLTDAGRVIRYVNDEPLIKSVALEMRKSAEARVQSDAHEAAAWLGCAALMQVMRLWCRPSGDPEINFWIRGVQRRVWCAQAVYGHQPNAAYKDVWPNFHAVASGADKAKLSTIKLLDPSANAEKMTKLEVTLRKQYDQQIQGLLQQQTLLADAVNTLRDGLV